ncbi:PAS domain-containing sensor histidine kinase [Luteimonas sp. 50]|uniref:histidine kinase n=1 Tax=Cognatiluteimonas sedimenti TaxID=2927791 RepID=A0ABT0A2F9_9GAMM|nr:PAS domain S-box protein [Lysobacter sedimenti]MCJ0825164.1 PAS domain-containing sensor histidine kinase [Lysobacter sedimenti]
MNELDRRPSTLAPIADADYRLMVETVSDYAIFMLDPAGLIRSWNIGARRLTGYAADEVIGHSFEMFYPQDQLDIGLPRHELEGALRLGRIEDEGWRLRKDGSRFWANVVITALRDGEGGHRGFAKVTRDLSARREHEELLRQSEEMFRLMVEGVRDYAIFMLDPQGHIISWNLGAQITKGYTAEEIIGQHFSVFYPQEQRDRDWPGQELVLALRDGRLEDEGWRLRKDGSRFWANVVITALYDGNGRHRGFAKVTRDLTRQRRIDILEHEGRHLQQFIAMLGHELRNPLAAIANATALLQAVEPPPPRLRDLRALMSRQVAHLRRLIDDLLDVGRIVSGKVHLERTPLRLQQVVEESVEASAPELDKRGQQLVIDVEPEPLWVLGDKVRLVQVLNNLLHNAGKFTPEGGLVRIALRREGGNQAALHVSDTGCGIPPQELNRVFELFRQGEQAATPGHGGFGIGLNLVHQVALLHDGDVSAFSTGRPGEGAEFIVRLPLVDAPAEAGS